MFSVLSGDSKIIHQRAAALAGEVARPDAAIAHFA